MQLRYQFLSLTKIIPVMLPPFLVSCTSTQYITNSQEKGEIVPQVIIIPIERVMFLDKDKGTWRIITQSVDYKDGTNFNSLSSFWVFEQMPLEAIVLDNPKVVEDSVNHMQNEDSFLVIPTNFYVPFIKTILSSEFDELMPKCKKNEFRGLVQVKSSLKYIGIPEWKDGEFKSKNPQKPWFYFGNVVCMRLIKKLT